MRSTAKRVLVWLSAGVLAVAVAQAFATGAHRYGR